MSESDIQKQIIDYLTAKGYYAVKVQAGGAETKNGYIRLAPAGTPDVLACINGKFWGIEVKATERLSMDWWRQDTNHKRRQKATLKKIDKAGGKTTVVGSLNSLILILQNENHKRTSS